MLNVLLEDPVVTCRHGGAQRDTAHTQLSADAGPNCLSEGKLQVYRYDDAHVLI